MSSSRSVSRWARRWRPTRYKWRRRFVERCEHCGQHARWSESWHTRGSREVWHGPCMALETWRDAAEERLTVISLVVEVAGLSSRDVETVAALREAEWTGRGRYQDLVWRAFYALLQRQEKAEATITNHQEQT